MRSITRWPAGMLAVAALLATAVGCGEDGMTATLPTSDDIVLTEIASGLERPVHLVGLPDDPGSSSSSREDGPGADRRPASVGTVPGHGRPDFRW